MAIEATPLENLIKLAAHIVQQPAEISREARLVHRLRWVGRGLLALSVILLLTGLWRLAELALGPILAPLLGAAALALIATVLHAIMRYKRRHLKKAEKTTELPLNLLGTVLELWLTPKPLRRTVFAGILLNKITKHIFH